MKSALSPQCLISLSSFSSFKPWLVYNLFPYKYIYKMVYVCLAEADARSKRTRLNGCIPDNLHFSMFIKQIKCLNPCFCSTVWWVRIAHTLRTLQQQPVNVLHQSDCSRSPHTQQSFAQENPINYLAAQAGSTIKAEYSPLIVSRKRIR